VVLAVDRTEERMVVEHTVEAVVAVEEVVAEAFSEVEVGVNLMVVLVEDLLVVEEEVVVIF
jgi:hypothetical protein